MRPIALTVLVLALGVPAAVAAPVEVARGPVRFQHGKLLVRVQCPDDACQGTLRADRAAASFALGEDLEEPSADFVEVRAAHPGRRVTLRVRQDGRTDRVRRTVRQGIDRRRCGFGKYAKPLASGGSTRLLRVQLDGRYSVVTACRNGTSLPVHSKDSDVYSSDGADVYAVSDDWAAVVASFTDHYGDGYSQVVARSLRRPSVWRSTYLGGAYGITLPEPKRLLMATDGAFLLGRSTPTGTEVCAFDASGGRVLDPGPNVDLASLALDGQIARWTRDGVGTSATLAGPAPDDGAPEGGVGGDRCEPPA